MNKNTSVSPKGLSLIEVMITMAVMGIVAVGVSTLVLNMQHSQNNIKFRMDADTVNEEIRNLLSSPRACLNTFGGLVANLSSSHSIQKINDGTTPPGVAIYNLNSVYGDSSLLLKTMTFAGFQPGASNLKGQMVLTTSFASNKVSQGAQVVQRLINVNLDLDTASTIIGCIAQAKMSDGIWQRTATNINNIFFVGPVAPTTGGRVGVGVADPLVTLDVNGSIRPGSNGVAVGSACPAEGAYAYDASAHLPVYCDQNFLWAFFNPPPAGCSAQTINNCILSSVNDGGNSGVCNTGMTGTCAYHCSNGNWTQTSNSCTATVINYCGGFPSCQAFCSSMNTASTIWTGQCTSATQCKCKASPFADDSPSLLMDCSPHCQ